MRDKTYYAYLDSHERQLVIHIPLSQIDEFPDHPFKILMDEDMKTRKGIKAKLDKLNDTKRKDTVIDFEQLGIDRLFIDESHFYKNCAKRCA